MNYCINDIYNKRLILYVKAFLKGSIGNSLENMFWYRKEILTRQSINRQTLKICVIFLENVCKCVYVLLQNYDSDADWPTWIHRTINISHFLLTVASSTNFFIYFAKHGRLCDWLDCCCCSTNRHQYEQTCKSCWHVCWNEVMQYVLCIYYYYTIL